ncbi:hypothetical protein [uncultured Tateyamaria sp.]|uniref:hypothetical protein n=1 Tax=uncultured Tateyamaria sp. TaxID=455651 RepID=UPI00263652EF|nr:hypothetical protein [uncultured Tateyamaria sp.]
MTPKIDIPAHEHGAIRVFSLSMSDDAARAFKDDAAQLVEMLGVPVDADHIEVFALSDLEGVGLAGYLADGHAVPDAELAPDRIKLDKLGGWVMIVYSRAFSGAATTLTPAPALTLIGTYGTAGTNWQATETITSEAAKPYSAPAETVKKRPSDAAMSGRIAMIVLIGLALFTWLFIWIAG